MPIDEVSAKVRSGGPVDEEADLALDVWAGHLPLETTAGLPVADVGVSAPWPHASPVDRRRS